MIREIMRDETFLAQKAETATADDLPVAADLLETLQAHRDGCVGMAANIMLNPEIIRRAEPYEAEEGCLSLSGTRKTKRWKSIKVQYQNEQMQPRFKTFKGFTAQIIQHEVDHCDGIII